MKAEWKMMRLADVCHVYQPETLSQKQLKDGPYPVYGANGQIGVHSDYNHENPELTLGCRGTCGSVNWTRGKTWINGNAMVVKADLSLVDPYFLTYALKGGINIKDAISGTAQPQITRKSLVPLKIPLPTLAEQKRVVALLDEAFVGIDEAKAKAEHAIKGYDELSRGMADRLLFPVNSMHPNKALGEVVEIARGGSPRPIQNYFTEAADGINWIKISDATASGKYIYKTVQKIKPSGLKKTRLVKPGDFLLSNSMSFGRPYIMKTTGCIHDGWLVLSGVERQLDQDYLYHVLGSSSVYAQFDRLAAGSTVRNLNSESASKVSIPVPPISLQKEIAEKLDHAEEVITAAKKLASMKYEALNSLQASLLAQAFAGELTA